jgi:hypothetical protein
MIIPLQRLLLLGCISLISFSTAFSRSFTLTGSTVHARRTKWEVEFAKVSNSIFTGYVEIHGKLWAHGSCFHQDVEIDASDKAFSATEPDLFLHESVLQGSLTAAARTIVFDSSVAKAVVIKAVKDAAGNNMPCIVKITGSTAIESLNFESGNGIVCLAEHASTSIDLAGGTLITEEELPLYLQQVAELVERLDAKSEEQRARHPDATEEQQAELIREMERLGVELNEVIHYTFDSCQRAMQELRDALILLGQEGLRNIVQPSPGDGEYRCNQARNILKCYPVIYKGLERLLQLEEEFNALQASKTSS